MSTRTLLRSLTPLLIAPALAAQQFQYQPGWIPGTPRWSEGVEAADVDQDGDLDLFFADGEGFSSAGTPRQNVLVINKLVETGPGIFADESVARLGAHLSNAKGVTTGDVNGDGWVDVLFLNAFNTAPPSLYINRGAAQPGYFDLESATRGFTAPLSSAGAQFGDIDDDGDLDLVVCDSGPSFLSGPGGKPHLYLNDGLGFFSEDTSFQPATKVAHMDIQLRDVDNDWDLDILGVNRATNSGGNHYLLLNDGAGNFSDFSTLIPPTSPNCYEAEVGDLDSDTDLDVFFISLSGFQEGHVENRLVPDGGLAFVAGTPQSGTIDDNEVAYLDADNDGDYDVLIGSLGPRERLYTNAGNLSFSDTSNAFTAVSDSTLDLTVADLDGDGAYDVITAQGESSAAQWANKVYRNTGSADSLPPAIVAERVPTAGAQWPVVLHAKVRDQVLDDGVDYLSGRAAYAPLQQQPSDVFHQGGAFHPATLQIVPGTPVRFTNRDATSESATSATAPWTFDLALAPQGGSATYVFVSPGTYVVTSTGSSAGMQIQVAGSAGSVPAFHAAGGSFRFALPARSSGPSGQFAYELFFRDFAGNESVGTSAVFDAPTCDYENYCSSTANSSGSPAVMGCNAETSVAQNDFALTAGPLPLQPGLFFYSAAPANGGAGLAFGNGLRCVGDASHAIVRLPVQQAEPDGYLRRTLDFNNLPSGGVIVGGSTWYFQAWFRDPAAGGAAFDLSDGLRVRFCP